MSDWMRVGLFGVTSPVAEPEPAPVEPVPGRLCVTCRHWQFSGGEPDYSEVTPGSPWRSGCARGHWHLDDYDTTAADWRRTLKMAETCRDYEAAREGER